MGRIADRIRLPAGAAMLALLIALTGGCSTNPPVAEGPAHAAADAPLEVWLPGPYDLHMGPWAVFHVNKPAYVAMFDIVPGVGVRALYPYGPAAGGQQRFHAGIQTVLTGRGTGSALARSVGWACQGIHAPVVWRMIVASERPLDLRALRPHVEFRYRPAIGGVHFAGGTAFRTMDRLLQTVLPSSATPDPAMGSEWAVDYVPYWTASGCRPSTRLALLQVDHYGRTGGERLPHVVPLQPEGEEGADEPAEEAPEEVEELRDRLTERLAGVPGTSAGNETGDGAKPGVREELRDVERPESGNGVGGVDTRVGTLERREIERRTFLPGFGERRGFDEAVGRNRTSGADRASSKGLRYLPNARMPSRTLRPEAPIGTPRAGVRSSGSSARPTAGVRHRPEATSATRPTPKVRSVPAARGKGSSSSADSEKQK